MLRTELLERIKEAEAGRAEDGRAEDGRVEDGRAEDNRAEDGRSEAGRAEAGRAGRGPMSELEMESVMVPTAPSGRSSGNAASRRSDAIGARSKAATPSVSNPLPAT
mmetsp:Transcript_1083/g.3300  ORF Transcript_1083/g.3300 Transcript_1083/m.3300 type:complete len:107 (-) Transcript_1083:394-714(-)